MDLRMRRKSMLRRSRYPSRLRHVWGDVRPKHDWQHPSGTTIAGVAALAALVFAATYYGPDFIRYLKIRRM